MASSQQHSRVCVKNLPDYVDEKQLRDLFSQKGEVTDVKVCRTRSGKSRRFGFVGFASTADAHRARLFFNMSFLDTRRLRVDAAVAIGSARLARPWSRYTRGSSANTHSQSKPKTRKRDLAKVTKEGDALSSGACGARHKCVTYTWKEKRARVSDETCTSVITPSSSGAGENRSLTTDAGLSNMAYLRAKSLGNASGSIDTHDISAREVVGQNGGSLFPSRTGGRGAGDKTDERSHAGCGKETGCGNSGYGPGCHMGNMRRIPGPKVVESGIETAEVSVSGNDELKARLFVRNLPYGPGGTENSVRSLFSRYGPLVSVHVPIDDAGRPKGFAFVLFTAGEDAAQAMRRLDGTVYCGRLLHIMPARAQQGYRNHVEDFTSANARSNNNGKIAHSFKAKRAQQTKELANDGINWNALFVRSDTVVRAVAEQRGIPQRDVIGAGSDRDVSSSNNSAVRLALGEAQIVADTKILLEKEGVNVVTLTLAAHRGVPVHRSDTTILVKNLPFSCDISGIRSMFSQHGILGRVVLPPSRAFALVEYMRSGDARRAFKALAYRRLKRVPLYLEWAPRGTFSCHSRSSGPGGSGQNLNEQLIADGPAATQGNLTETDSNSCGEIDDGCIANETCIYVKNIAFETSEDGLFAHVATAFGYAIPGGRVDQATKGDCKLARHHGAAKVMSQPWNCLSYTVYLEVVPLCNAHTPCGVCGFQNFVFFSIKY